MSAVTIAAAREAFERIEQWEAGERYMAERSIGRTSSTSGGSGRGQAGRRTAEERSLALAPEVARMRTRYWASVRTQRLVNLGRWMKRHLDRDVPGHDTMVAASAAAGADGEPMAVRQIWSLKELANPAKAAKRHEVNLLAVAYLAERWGSSLPEVWREMTTGEGAALVPAGGPASGPEAEAAALGDVYRHLRGVAPDLADALVLQAQFLLQQAERRGGE